MTVELWAGRTAEAEGAARRAVELGPSDPELRRRIATAWELAGEYERALEAYREAARLAPDSGETHMLLAIQMARLGEDEQASRHLARAGVHAEVPHLRNRLAVVYAARGETGRAETILRDLVRRHPDYPTARRNLAALLRKQGRGADAERVDPPPAPGA
jgi:Flp pilus assembly protein TadD